MANSSDLRDLIFGVYRAAIVHQEFPIAGRNVNA